MFIVAVGRAAAFTQPAELKTDIPLGAIMRGPRGKVAAANPEILSPEVGHDHTNTVRWAPDAILLKHAPTTPVKPHTTVA